LVFFALPLFNAIYISSTDPYLPGSLNTKSFSVLAFEEKDLPYHLLVYSPSSPGVYAVAFFLGGLAGNIPGLAYSETLRHMASHGVVVISIDTLPSIPIFFQTMVENVRKVRKWAQVNINQRLGEKVAEGVKADIEGHSALGCHSAGCKEMVKVADEDCNQVKGLFLLNPVDGLDPWGFVHEFVITPGQLLNYSSPTLILGAGLDSEPGIHIGNIFPACAPAELNSNRFWNATRCAKWLVNATDYGHGDFLDPFFL